MGKTVKNTDIMNAVRDVAGEQFQAGVPEATAENYQLVGKAIAEYTAHSNDFITALLDKIGLALVKSAQATNPLARFKKGTMPMGYTIEEIFVEIATRNDFNDTTAEANVFKKAKADVKTFYHSVSRQDFYKRTITREQLKHAFTSEDGLSRLISGIVESLVKADTHDEFQYMKQMLVTMANGGDIAKIEVADPLASASNMSEFVKKTREVSSKFTFLSSDYNKAGAFNSCAKEKQAILVTPEMEASLSVDVLASAFNMEKTDYLANRVLIDKFAFKKTDATSETTTTDDVVAMLVSEDVFMVYDTEYSTETLRNPEGLYWNNWLHHWQIISGSMLENAVMFTRPTV